MSDLLSLVSALCLEKVQLSVQNNTYAALGSPMSWGVPPPSRCGVDSDNEKTDMHIEVTQYYKQACMTFSSCSGMLQILPASVICDTSGLVYPP